MKQEATKEILFTAHTLHANWQFFYPFGLTHNTLNTKTYNNENGQPNIKHGQSKKLQQDWFMLAALKNQYYHQQTIFRSNAHFLTFCCNQEHFHCSEKWW